MTNYELDLLNEELEINMKRLHQKIGEHMTIIFNEENKEKPDLELIDQSKESIRLLNAKNSQCSK
jgi:hypothetical protein